MRRVVHKRYTPATIKQTEVMVWTEEDMKDLREKCDQLQSVSHVDVPAIRERERVLNKWIEDKTGNR